MRRRKGGRDGLVRAGVNVEGERGGVKRDGDGLVEHHLSLCLHLSVPVAVVKSHIFRAL